MTKRRPAGLAIWLVIAFLAAACASGQSGQTAASPPAASGGAPPEEAADTSSAEESGAGLELTVVELERGAAAPVPGVEVRPFAERLGLDVQHYSLSLDLSDLSDAAFSAVAEIRFRVKPEALPVRFDLAGLTVDSVRVDGGRVEFRHDGAVLTLLPDPTPFSVDGPAEHTAHVHYHGTPRDGLFFGPDPTGGATAFADNWPNRARWWFPSNDHPWDKATVRYEVLAPDGFQVIANGFLAGQTGEQWVWETRVPIPVYTMVVGVARFQGGVLGRSACGLAPEGAARGCVEVSVLPLPGDSAYAFERFSRAPDMVDFYAELIGPYPYEKLAHVQSSTQFGGMENSSAIFYAMTHWTNREMGEGIIAHETAHQWFGNSVTPGSWQHLWLSEGFASYLDPVYFQARDGERTFRGIMSSARERYLASEVTDEPIVGRERQDLMSLLNANNYQKGAWVLHMLRGIVGDSAFFGGMRAFYERFENQNAVTEDFRKAVEAASGEELSWFFDQWVYGPGYPQLQAEWWMTSEGGRSEVVIEVTQTQPAAWPTFRIPLEVEIRAAEGTPLRRSVLIEERTSTFRLPAPPSTETVRLDPDEWVLKTLEISKRPS